jgi:ribosome-associated protein
MTKKNTEQLLKSIVRGIEELKGEEITILDLREIENSVCDFFVITEAQSSTQVKAISGSVEKQTKEERNEKPWHIEGLENAEWVLMDYVSIVVHVFRKEARKFYDIESLWGDAPAQSA